MTRATLLIALLGCGAQRDGAEAQPSAPERVPASADVRHYELVVAVDLERAAVSGTVEIEVDVRGGEMLVLDARGIEVERVEVDGRAAVHTRVRDDLHVALPVGDARRRVKIAYLGYGSRGLRAARGGIHTHHHTEDWMPCRMDPSDRATIAMTLDVREELVVAAVGEPHGVEKAGQGRELHRFRLAQEYPAYVMGFAVGKFEERKYVEGDIAYRDLSLVHDEAEMARIFADVPHMVTFFEERSGVRYPMSRFEQVIVTGWVGMEHAGFTVVGEPWARSVLADPKEDWLAAHELAHQWWGNSITCASWDHFWLNEAFAVFMTAAWKEERWGREQYDREMSLARERWARIRRLDREHALAGDSWRWPGPGGDALPYTKGTLVLGYLRYVLGEEAFWEGVRRYSQRHAGGSVTTQDLERAMNAPDGFFEQWVWRSGAPSVRASGRVRDGAFELTLVQSGEPWRLRVPVRVVDDGGERDIDVDIHTPMHRIRIPVEGTVRDVRIDPRGVLPVVIEISAGR